MFLSCAIVCIPILMRAGQEYVFIRVSLNSIECHSGMESTSMCGGVGTRVGVGGGGGGWGTLLATDALGARALFGAMHGPDCADGLLMECQPSRLDPLPPTDGKGGGGGKRALVRPPRRLMALPRRGLGGKCFAGLSQLQNKRASLRAARAPWDARCLSWGCRYLPCAAPGRTGVAGTRGAGGTGRGAQVLQGGRPRRTLDPIKAEIKFCGGHFVWGSQWPKYHQKLVSDKNVE